LFNRGVRVDTMLIEEIDAFNAKAAQTSFTCLLHVSRFSVDAAKSGIARSAQNSKLCRENNLIAVSLQNPSDEFFVCVRTISVRRVEERDAEFESAIQCRDRFFFIASAVEIGHPHATETDRRDARSAASEFALFHICPIQMRGAHSSQRSRI